MRESRRISERGVEQCFPVGWLERGEDKGSFRMVSWFLFHLGAGGPTRG